MSTPIATHNEACESQPSAAVASPLAGKPLRAAGAASLLVAALALLRQPCSRSRANARRLLDRAAEFAELTPDEREVCRGLADDIDVERRDVDAPTARWRSGFSAA